VLVKPRRLRLKMPTPRAQLENHRFGLLQVIRFIEVKDRHAWFEAKCECGTVVIARGSELTSNTRRKCSPTCTWEKPKFTPTFRTLYDGSKQS
jgi:hypothetical protein